MGEVGREENQRDRAGQREENDEWPALTEHRQLGMCCVRNLKFSSFFWVSGFSSYNYSLHQLWQRGEKNLISYLYDSSFSPSKKLHLTS